MTHVLSRITVSVATEPERTRFYCVKCKKCNAGLSGAIEAVRVFVKCDTCREVTEAVRG